MKRILFLGLAMMIGFSLPVYASAEEEVHILEQQTELNGMDEENPYLEEKEYLEEAPWTYGEMENGIFIRRSINDELSWLNRSDERYFDEMAKAQEARKMEALTFEMEAEGWELVNDNPTPPEEAEGDRSAEEIHRENQKKELESLNEITKYDEKGNPIVNYGYGYVSFIGTVQSKIHETCFIEVTNTSSKKTYLFELYEPNSYSTSKQLPEGTYIITDGGIPDDYTDEYPIKGDSFKVISGGATVVNFTIGNIDGDELENGITVEINKEKEPKTETIAEEKAKKSSIVTIIVWIVTVTIIALCIFIVYKKAKKGNNIE